MAAEPTYPIPAVRLIVPDSQGRILLLKRSDTAYGLGQWCLPGGKVDYGQTVEASRPVTMFTIWQARSCRFLFYQDSLPPEPGSMHCINFYFECEYVGEIHLNSESGEAVWITRQDLERYDVAFRNDEKLRRYWKLKPA